MKKQLPVIFCLLIPILGSTQSDEKKSLDLIRNMANELVEVAHLPGMSVAISKDGKLIFAEGFGYADIENKIKVTPETQFRTASVAKVITATAAGKLVQEKKLDLSLPIQTYIPYYTVKMYPITAGQLAGQISGMGHYSPEDKVESRYYSTVREGLEVFSHRDLVAEPGTKYIYSSHGYTLLSAVIEGAAGTPFLEYIKKEVFVPLNMPNTGPDMRTQQPNTRAAKIYNLTADIPQEEKSPEDVSYKWAGGGMVSTPTDLVHMAHGYSNGFLQPATVKMMFESQTLRTGQKTQVGIGWRISQDFDSRTVYEHAGSMEGARSAVCIYPNEKLVISLMVNAEWASNIEETAHMMARVLLTPASPKATPQGEFKILITNLNNNGEHTTEKGLLILKNGIGELIPEIGQPASVHYLGKDNVYAYIRHDGIYYMTIEFTDKTISGRAIAYGSRLAESPIKNPPFMEFASEK